MKDIFKLLLIYAPCLLLVSACWVGLEYVIEGAVHNSDVDGAVAVILSYLITEKIFDWSNNHGA